MSYGCGPKKLIYSIFSTPGFFQPPLGRFDWQILGLSSDRETQAFRHVLASRSIALHRLLENLAFSSFLVLRSFWSFFWKAWLTACDTLDYIGNLSCKCAKTKHDNNKNKCKLNARAFQLEQNKCTSPPERVPIRTKLLQHERDLLTKSKIGKQIFVLVKAHIEFVNPPYFIAIFASEQKTKKNEQLWNNGFVSNNNTKCGAFYQSGKSSLKSIF